jgi:hypothetical protein
MNTASNPSRPKFSLGLQVVATPGALEALAKARQTPHEFLARHVSGDWGDVCPEDAALNDEALNDGSRLLSAFTLKTGEKLWVITEAADDEGQRAATTLLLPEEY